MTSEIGYFRCFCLRLAPCICMASNNTNFIQLSLSSFTNLTVLHNVVLSCQEIPAQNQNAVSGSTMNNWDYTSNWFWNSALGCINCGPLIFWSGASTWQNLTAWLEREQKLMDYIAVHDLLLRTPCRNSNCWMRVIRFVHICGYLSVLPQLNEITWHLCCYMHILLSSKCHFLVIPEYFSAVALPILFPHGPLRFV